VAELGSRKISNEINSLVASRINRSEKTFFYLAKKQSMRHHKYKLGNTPTPHESGLQKDVKRLY
jgi:hypothetical protein